MTWRYELRTPSWVPLVAASKPTAVATDATVKPILEKRCHIGVVTSELSDVGEDDFTIIDSRDASHSVLRWSSRKRESRSNSLTRGRTRITSQRCRS